MSRVGGAGVTGRAVSLSLSPTARVSVSVSVLGRRRHVKSRSRSPRRVGRPPSSSSAPPPLLLSSSLASQPAQSVPRKIRRKSSTTAVNTCQPLPSTTTLLGPSPRALTAANDEEQHRPNKPLGRAPPLQCLGRAGRLLSRLGARGKVCVLALDVCGGWLGRVSRARERVLDSWTTNDEGDELREARQPALRPTAATYHCELLFACAVIRSSNECV